jgi:hypothetical protein
MTPSPTNATFAIISSVLQHGRRNGISEWTMLRNQTFRHAHGPAGSGASTPIGEIDRRIGRPI